MILVNINNSSSRTSPQCGDGNGEGGLGVIDTVVVVLIISVFIGVFIPRYYRLAREAQEISLTAGLNNVRMALDLYKLHNGEYPNDLRELIKKEYIQPYKEDTIFKGEYLKDHALDDEGYPIDPFKNRYKYDPAAGRVSSLTPGYETW